VQLKGATVGIVGALAAFPRRLAEREVTRLGARLRRGLTRQTKLLVFGRRALSMLTDEAIEKRFDAAEKARVKMVSENGFRRLLGLIDAPAGNADMSRTSFAIQTDLELRMLDLLTLFDAFEHDGEPFSFRDTIIGRKYQRLLAAGTAWGAIVRSVHRSGNVTSLTAASLESEGSRVVMRSGERVAELDGQHRLPLGEDESDADAVFEAAVEAEQGGDFRLAARLYAQCLALDPSDSVSAYNLGNAYKEAGDIHDARSAYMKAIKLDPNLVEAWFNYGSMLSEHGETEAARLHLGRAIEIDADYADPIYNLAALEYDAGRLGEARRWWMRYVELDPDSEWGKRAQRGIAYANMALGARNKAS
jgi:tetratricopeptide (TPR) repeat protein